MAKKTSSKKTTPKEKIISVLNKGMWKDSLHSMQPQGSWRDAWSVVIESDDEGNFGVSNEPSNELMAELPGNVRGMIYVEERDLWVVFVKGDTEEIGIISEKDRCYKTVVDSSILEDIGACDTDWIDVTAKVVHPCNDLYIYWSSGDTYRKLNLDDPCCKFEETELLKCTGVASLKTLTHDRSGILPNGKYGFAARLRDKDGNDTNWHPISSLVSVAGGDYKPGENSEHAINVKFDGLHKDYGLVDIAVVSIVDNLVSVKWVDTVSYGKGGTDYLYMGDTGREVDMKISDIIGRTPKYFYGKNLIQYDGRLLLYNLRPENNIDYQRQANDIEVTYTNNVVPTRYAHQFSGLRPNEQYWFGIRWNYCDETHSADFMISGRAAGAGDTTETGSCRDGCPLPVWRVEDTSQRENLYLEDVHDTNPNYDDVTEYVDPISDEIDKLTDDEKTHTKFDPDTEVPNGDEFNEEFDAARINTGELLDCICDSIADMVINKGLGTCEGCDQPGTITEALLLQLGCMCADRTKTGGDPNVVNAPRGSSGGGVSGGTIRREPKVIVDGTSIDGAGTRAVADLTNEWYATGKGRTTEVELDYLIHKTVGYFDELKSAVSLIATDNGTIKKISTGEECFTEGLVKCNGTACTECIGGEWYYLNNGDKYQVKPGMKRTVKGGTGPVLDSLAIKANGGTSSDFSFEYIYDEDGCTIIGVKPKKYSDGKFGYWETRETYPMTENCECEKIYGDLAGENLRLHRVPSVTKEPHFVSFSGGVPSQFDRGNEEDKNSFTFFISPKFDNITPPKNLPKPLNEENPFTITYVKRTEGNKTVLGSGIGISCFKGEIQGEDFAFPKHGVSSFERFDRSIEPAGEDTHRGGEAILDAAPYVIHSPDFHMRRPPLNATDCLIELEYFGRGFRHGMYAKGDIPDDPRLATVNQKGTRQSLNLNHFQLPNGSNGSPIFRCVKAMSHVPADTILSKSDEFTYSLCNLWRESSTYVELDGIIQTLDETSGTTDKYGGILNGTEDGASDRSFTGDTLNHEMPIHDVRAPYMTFTVYQPNQYGSPISQSYIPIGLEGDRESFKSGSIEGVVGDSYVNTMSVKRTSYISNKTNRKLSFIDNSLGIIASTKWWNALFKSLLKAISRTISVKKCGHVPVSGDMSDYRNIFGGLREHGNVIGQSGHGGEKTDGVIPPVKGSHRIVTNNSDYNDGDNYYPQVLKSNVFSWYNSDVNLKYRQKGSVDAGEVHYKELKGLTLDSSMSSDVGWKKTYLNRFYPLLEENARWKQLAVPIILFLFTYGIGIWMIYQGVMATISAASAFGGGSYLLRSIGAGIATAIGVGVVAVGIIWIQHWAQSDADNKVVENIIGLKNCRPDVKNADNSYSLSDDMEQFEDNYWRYDNSHSWVNRFEFGYGMSDPYNTCYCPEERTNIVRYSNKQILDSSIDSWSNFKANNTVDIPTNNGNISKMFQIGNGLFVHTTDMIISLQAGSRELKMNKDTLLLGTGDLFNRTLPIYGGVIEGYGGLLDPNAAVVSNWGYIFPDREARRLYTFNGSALPKPVSDKGVRGFLQEEGYLRLVKQFPYFKLVDLKTDNGVGFSIGVDHEHGRMLFSKRDYEADEGVTLDEDCLTFRSPNGEKIALGDPNYFCDKSFTLSYSPEKDAWISSHYYVPHLYAWNRFNMFSFDCKGIWEHNIKGKFQEFYGKSYPFSIDVVANDKEMLSSFNYVSSDVDIEAYRWDEYDYLRSPRVFFDEAVAYNSHQSTGLISFIDGDNISILAGSRENTKSVKTEFNLRRWNYSKIYDKLVAKDSHIFNNRCGIGPRTVNKEAHMAEGLVNHDFYDNFLSTIYIYHNIDNDIKLFLKNIRTDIEIEEVQ